MSLFVSLVNIFFVLYLPYSYSFYLFSVLISIVRCSYWPLSSWAKRYVTETICQGHEAITLSCVVHCWGFCLYRFHVCLALLILCPFGDVSSSTRKKTVSKTRSRILLLPNPKTNIYSFCQNAKWLMNGCMNGKLTINRGWTNSQKTIYD